MSTRSVIAIAEGDGFRGRYCHSDGYPTNQLPVLTEMYANFGGDHEAMLKFLTEDHCGWSYIGPEGHTGYLEDRWRDMPDDERQAMYRKSMCYCHGDRDESLDWITHDGDDWGTEWAYAMSERGIAVFERTYPDDKPAWTFVGFHRWVDELTETTAGAMECGEDYSRCSHYAWYHFPEANVPGFDRLGTAEWLGLAPIERFDRHPDYFEIGGVTYGTGGGSRVRTATGYSSKWQSRLYEVDPITFARIEGGRTLDMVTLTDDGGVSKPAKGVKFVFPRPPHLVAS